MNSDIVSPSNSSLSPNLIISPVKMNQSYMDLTTDLKKRIEELEAREAAVRKEVKMRYFRMFNSRILMNPKLYLRSTRIKWF